MNNFSLVYQPKICDGKIFSCEALIRPHNSEDVKEFVINHSDPEGLDRSVIKQVISDKEKNLIDFNISVNVSSESLLSKTFINHCISTIKDKNITLELTEYGEISNSLSLSRNIKSLQKNGIKVSLDDFGKGNSHSILLTKNKFDQIKIDKDLIADIDTNNNIFNHLKYLVEMFNKLGFNEIVYEGVETEFQHASIIKIDSNAIIQGYYFSKPTDINSVIDLWVKRK